MTTNELDWEKSMKTSDKLFTNITNENLNKYTPKNGDIDVMERVPLKVSFICLKKYRSMNEIMGFDIYHNTYHFTANFTPLWHT